jgi:hypothetical protein
MTMSAMKGLTFQSPEGDSSLLAEKIKTWEGDWIVIDQGEFQSPEGDSPTFYAYTAGSTCGRSARTRVLSFSPPKGISLFFNCEEHEGYPGQPTYAWVHKSQFPEGDS